SGAGRILRHHKLLKRVRGHAAYLACDVGQWLEIVRNARVSARRLARENIFVAKGAYAPVALMTVELEWFQWKPFKLSDQVFLLRERQNVRDVTETRGQLRLTEQVAHVVAGVGRVSLDRRAAREHRLGFLGGSAVVCAGRHWRRTSLSVAVLTFQG